MKANKLSELSIEELESKKKTILSATIGLGIVMILACCALFYFAISSKNFALIAVAIGGSLTFVPSLISISQINSEIKSRKSKYL
ncbi:hypothetical protein [Chryseobacterium sp.]|uniref:hypothetical protein n=1 Tax=Chryseobacterium sp. TaxID=1871047 RepID=UPI002FCB26FB